jgi:hypothetical protein
MKPDIKDKLLDELLENYSGPGDLLGPDGLLTELKKRLINRVATLRGRAARAAERGAMSIVNPLLPILDRLPRVSSALGETTLISPPSGPMALSRLPCKFPQGTAPFSL